MAWKTKKIIIWHLITSNISGRTYLCKCENFDLFRWKFRHRRWKQRFEKNAYAYAHIAETICRIKFLENFLKYVYIRYISKNIESLNILYWPNPLSSEVTFHEESACENSVIKGFVLVVSICSIWSSTIYKGWYSTLSSLSFLESCWTFSKKN